MGCGGQKRIEGDLMEKKIVILGAGPTGLGAGYRLKELGYTNFHMYDRNPYIGGLATSFTDEAVFTWDIGGHVMFSHYEYYDKCFEAMMGDEYQENMRECWVRMFDRWVPYPFQNNIRFLPPEVCYECMAGLIEAQTKRDHKKAKNFGEFIDAVFGDGIGKHFMRPYNFKVWAHEPEMMNKEWIGERVAVLDINRALKNVILGNDDFGWGPNNMFKYPLRGGTGEFYKRMGEHLSDHITLNAEVEYIDSQHKQIYFADGSIVKYDILITTLPLDLLCSSVLNGAVPKNIKVAAGRLQHSSGYMVGIGLKQPCPSTKSWMYFPEDNCPFYRVTYLSNYSKYMTPDPDTHYSLLCETSASEFKPENGDTIVEDTIQGLINCGMLKEEDRQDIVSTWVYYADYSYPTPSVERDEILAEVIPWLEERDIYSRGRFGMWKYEVANTDHSLMQGVELVNRLLLDEPETTIGIKYESTEDGRKAAAHERSVKAGSGDPKKEAERLLLAASKQVGDKPDEPHTSEEELGVTQTTAKEHGKAKLL
ncbi:UDP-galactopyranose mutase [Fimbriimonas ginsengisoli Gsoil 348]|uniref:UDP-galactopyranose mutase n=2 Tax=Fimbriimonas ginsengisoli TaxID=1005039 RepID=A0A068NNE2_FIMGI|nr:UDP-galactopyranose mutase [Fimbriimonas ginsengisoli Gsoil 348]